MSKRAAVLEATPLIPGLGAKVVVDFATALDAATRAALSELFERHHLLFIEAPGLTREAQLELFSSFGVLNTIPDGRDEILVSNVLADGYLGSYELEWHTDGSYLAEPYDANCLYAIDVQAGRSATRFVSSAEAWRRMPESLQKKLQYLQILNTSEIKTPRGERLATHGPDLLAAAHRIVDYRPGNPTPYITANVYQTDCVLGMDAATSRALLDEVYAILYDERHVYEHSWKNGDFVVWDNRVVHHARGDMSNVGARTLRRFTAGGAPSVEQIPWPQMEKLQKNFRARLGPDGKPRAEAGAG